MAAAKCEVLQPGKPPVLAKVQSNMTSEEAVRIFAAALTTGEQRFNEVEELARAGKTAEAIELFERLCTECRTSWIDRESRKQIDRLRASESNGN